MPEEDIKVVFSHSIIRPCQSQHDGKTALSHDSMDGA